jgi:hypothetical protein
MASDQGSDPSPPPRRGPSRGTMILLGILIAIVVGFFVLHTTGSSDHLHGPQGTRSYQLGYDRMGPAVRGQSAPGKQNPAGCEEALREYVSVHVGPEQRSTVPDWYKPSEARKGCLDYLNQHGDHTG